MGSTSNGEHSFDDKNKSSVDKRKPELSDLSRSRLIEDESVPGRSLEDRDESGKGDLGPYDGNNHPVLRHGEKKIDSDGVDDESSVDIEVHEKSVGLGLESEYKEVENGNTCDQDQNEAHPRWNQATLENKIVTMTVARIPGEHISTVESNFKISGEGIQNEAPRGEEIRVEGAKNKRNQAGIADVEKLHSELALHGETHANIFKIKTDDEDARVGEVRGETNGEETRARADSGFTSESTVSCSSPSPLQSSPALVVTPPPSNLVGALNGPGIPAGNNAFKSSISEAIIPCDICGRRFRGVADVRSHVAAIHLKNCEDPERRFKCDFCPFRAYTKTSIRQHMFLHTGEVPYKCDLCSYGARQKFHLDRHRKKAHGMNPISKRGQFLGRPPSEASILPISDFLLSRMLELLKQAASEKLERRHSENMGSYSNEECITNVEDRSSVERCVTKLSDQGLPRSRYIEDGNIPGCSGFQNFAIHGGLLEDSDKSRGGDSGLDHGVNHVGFQNCKEKVDFDESYDDRSSTGRADFSSRNTPDEGKGSLDAEEVEPGNGNIFDKKHYRASRSENDACVRKKKLKKAVALTCGEQISTEKSGVEIRSGDIHVGAARGGVICAEGECVEKENQVGITEGRKLRDERSWQEETHTKMSKILGKSNREETRARAESALDRIVGPATTVDSSSSPASQSTLALVVTPLPSNLVGGPSGLGIPTGNSALQSRPLEANIPCGVCGSVFRSVADMISHVAIHFENSDNPERRFQCDYCPFRAFTKTTIRQHMLLHTGEVPFKCDLCGYGARQKFHLDRHRHKVHGISLLPKRGRPRPLSEMSIPPTSDSLLGGMLNRMKAADSGEIEQRHCHIMGSSSNGEFTSNARDGSSVDRRLTATPILSIHSSSRSSCIENRNGPGGSGSQNHCDSSEDPDKSGEGDSGLDHEGNHDGLQDDEKKVDFDGSDDDGSVHGDVPKKRAPLMELQENRDRNLPLKADGGFNGRVDCDSWDTGEEGTGSLDSGDKELRNGYTCEKTYPKAHHRGASGSRDDASVERKDVKIAFARIYGKQILTEEPEVGISGREIHSGAARGGGIHAEDVEDKENQAGIAGGGKLRNEFARREQTDMKIFKIETNIEEARVGESSGEANGGETRASAGTGSTGIAVPSPIDLVRTPSGLGIPAGNNAFQFRTSEANIPCDICGRRFRSVADVRSHAAALHLKNAEDPERKFECDFCPFRAYTKTSIRQHMFLHTGEVPYKCDLCSYGARQKFHLDRHRQKIHGMGPTAKRGRFSGAASLPPSEVSTLPVGPSTSNSENESGSHIGLPSEPEMSASPAESPMVLNGIRLDRETLAIANDLYNLLSSRVGRSSTDGNEPSASTEPDHDSQNNDS